MLAWPVSAPTLALMCSSERGVCARGGGVPGRGYKMSIETLPGELPTSLEHHLVGESRDRGLLDAETCRREVEVKPCRARVHVARRGVESTLQCFSRTVDASYVIRIDCPALNLVQRAKTDSNLPIEFLSANSALGIVESGTTSCNHNSLNRFREFRLTRPSWARAFRRRQIEFWPRT